MISFDWNQVRAFLATVEEGSLSAAARALGSTQPTLSRQVNALEQSLGVVLFERSSRSMTLTKSGLELFEHVQAMGEAAARISIAAKGQSQAIEGNVTITATDQVSHYLLPALLDKLKQKAPMITIELLPSNDVRDLTKREADIAIRHVRPTQADLIANRVCDSSAKLYASKGYVKAVQTISELDDLSQLDFIGLAPIERYLPNLQAQGLDITAKNFTTTTSNGSVLVELVRQGLGISILPSHTADLFPDLICLLPESFSIQLSFWLVTHRELHTSQRIRVVYDFLAESLSTKMLH